MEKLDGMERPGPRLLVALDAPQDFREQQKGSADDARHRRPAPKFECVVEHHVGRIRGLGIDLHALAGLIARRAAAARSGEVDERARRRPEAHQRPPGAVGVVLVAAAHMLEFHHLALHAVGRGNEPQLAEEQVAAQHEQPDADEREKVLGECLDLHGIAGWGTRCIVANARRRSFATRRFKSNYMYG